MAIGTGVLQALQERFGTALDGELERWIERAAPEPLFPGMMRYQMGTVNADLQPTGTTGGKRFRPLLCLLCAEASGGDAISALEVAAAVELLHNFSLVHDDIEDRDPERRHRPTVWKVWGEPQALNAGDGMHALASRAALAARIPDAQRVMVATRFAEMTLDLTRGQFLDMSFEARLDVSTAEYMQMISLKSASIIAFSAWSGAAIAGASATTREALHRYGLHLGRAFQIEDDLQGIWGSPQKTGKQPATDIRNRKKSLPVLLALEHATDARARTLTRFYRGDGGDVEAVVRTIESLGVREASRETLRAELAAARTALGETRLVREGTAALEAIALELTGEAEG